MMLRHAGQIGLLLGALVMVLGCTPTRQYAIQGADRAAGSDAHVTIERQETGNWMVTFEVNNLLPPERLEEGLTTYSVWFQAGEGAPSRAGNLAYDADARTGTMAATTSHQAFQLIMTGESDPAAGSPSENVVFRSALESP
jgi:hypothetical protein